MVRVDELKNFVGKEVEVRGWVYRKRSTKTAAFLVLRDASGIVQCVAKGDLWEKVDKIPIESSIIVYGIVKKDERAPGGVEIEIKRIEPVHLAERFPITKDQSTEFLLDVRHLWIRSKKMSSMLKVKHFACKYFREFFEKEGFFEVHPPMLTKTGAEGGATLFAINYFGETAYLPQTAQLYLEALITSLEKVYSLTPSFRAEKSKTPRHLTEFWHLEAEMAWYDNEANMDLQERMIKYVCKKIAENHADLLSVFNVEPKTLIFDEPFPRIEYDEAIEILQRKGFDIKWGEDFGAPHEKALTEDFDTPIFVCNYPRAVKAFYMKIHPKDERKVLCSDMLAPGHGEIIGGSERIWDVNELLERMAEFNLPIEPYKWYIDLRRYGSVPHSGFGLGLERFIKWILNLEHIRDAVAFPRTLSRIYP